MVPRTQDPSPRIEHFFNDPFEHMETPNEGIDVPARTRTHRVPWSRTLTAGVRYTQNNLEQGI